MSQTNKRVISKEAASKYEWKLFLQKRYVVEYVHENAALCDELADIQEEIIIRNEERKYLLRKLCLYEPQVEQEVEALSKSLYSQPVISPGENNTGNNSKKSNKRKTSEDKDKKVPAVKAKKPPAKPRKKTVQPLPLDTFGRPVFPIELGSLTIHYLGEVLSDLEFHCEEVIYPVGFVSTKIYGSIKDPTVKCMYTCKVSDNHGSPRFEISSDEDMPPIIGGTPDVCHSILLQHINDCLSLNVVSTKPRGNDFFGLSHPTVVHLVQGSPKARKCFHYRWTKIEVAKTADATGIVEDSDASLSYEMLQRSINYCRCKMAPDQQPQTTNVLTDYFA